MKVALFLTTELAAAAPLVQRTRQQYPDAAMAVFVRDEHIADLGPLLTGCDVRRDKPVGSKLAFVRATRRERFDVAVTAWHGGERFQPMRLVALVCGAGRVVAVDERGKEQAVSWYRPWTWAGHALRRLRRTKALTALRVCAAVYRATIGAILAVLLLLPTFARVLCIPGLGRKP